MAKDVGNMVLVTKCPTRAAAGYFMERGEFAALGRDVKDVMETWCGEERFNRETKRSKECSSLEMKLVA